MEWRNPLSMTVKDIYQRAMIRLNCQWREITPPGNRVIYALPRNVTTI